jgi:hypothetical protein
VRVRTQDGGIVKTAIFDNVPCCDDRCPDRQGCGFPILAKDGPANNCPRFYGRFSATVGEIGRCVAPGEIFMVPMFIATAGNVVDNSWSGGSHCSADDKFEPYSDSDPATRDRWGGFIESCPDPKNPYVVCIPSDCETATRGGPREPESAATAEVIEPYGNEYFIRWDRPEINLRWRPTSEVRADRYRVVAYDWRQKILDVTVNCPHDTCSYEAWFPTETAAYYWWVQPLPEDSTGEQSRAGHFNLTPPLTSCSGLGGVCINLNGPPGPTECPGNGTLISGAADCPGECCSGNCSIDEGHDHSGSCGSYDVCGHVFGSPNDPGCGPGPPPDTESCGALGGNYCSTTNSCPPGHISLGTTRQNGAVECQSCCQHSIGDGYCEPFVENCGISPADCACLIPGSVCSSTGSDGECVMRCSDPAYHDHTGSCGELDECGHPIGEPSDCYESCGAMGGDHCSQNAWCPDGFSPLGPSSDCATCCKENPCQSTGCPAGSCGWQTDNCGNQIHCGDCAPTCGAMGGDYCSPNNGCPFSHEQLGPSSDCTMCCRERPTCGAMGGDFCSPNGTCPTGHISLGPSSDCVTCCQAPPSCGEMGGNYCSPTPSCPGGYTALGPSNDCAMCCLY